MKLLILYGLKLEIEEYKFSSLPFPNSKRLANWYEMEINNGQPLACDITRDSSFKCNNMLNKK